MIRLGDYSTVDWSEADIVYIPSISYSEKKLINLLQYGKNLRCGSKIITLRLPQISTSGVSGLKGVGVKGGEISKKFNNFDNDNNVSNDNNDYNDGNDDNNSNNDNNNHIDNENYEKYFNFERTLWLKTSWGRMRAYLLIRNNTT
jgi:hypothetical protein